MENKEKQYPFFMYGTLMLGFGNHFRIRNIFTEMKKAILQGFDMYELWTYPGIIPGKGKIHGELYYILPEHFEAILKELDRVESGAGYHRELKEVTDNEGIKVLAYVYILNYNISDNYNKIESGDWKEYYDNFLI